MTCKRALGIGLILFGIFYIVQSTWFYTHPFKSSNDVQTTASRDFPVGSCARWAPDGRTIVAGPCAATPPPIGSIEPSITMFKTVPNWQPFPEIIAKWKRICANYRKVKQLRPDWDITILPSYCDANYNYVEDWWPRYFQEIAAEEKKR